MSSRSFWYSLVRDRQVDSFGFKMFFGGDFPFEGMGGGGMPGGMPGGGRRGPQGPVDNKEFYELLGVESSATENEIKKAYKRGALKHHPDKGGDPEMVCFIAFSKQK